VAEGGQHARLHGGLDHHDLGARSQPAYEIERLALGAAETRRRHVRGLHGGRGVEDDDDSLGSMPHDGDRRTSRGQGEGEEGEELQDQERIALQALEEGGGLAVAPRRIPQQEAGHRRFPPPHLEEIQEDEGDGQRTDEQGQGGEEAHARSNPLSCRRVISSTGVSVTTR